MAKPFIFPSVTRKEWVEPGSTVDRRRDQACLFSGPVAVTQLATLCFSGADRGGVGRPLVNRSEAAEGRRSLHDQDARVPATPLAPQSATRPSASSEERLMSTTMPDSERRSPDLPPRPSPSEVVGDRLHRVGGGRGDRIRPSAPPRSTRPRRSFSSNPRAALLR